MPFFTYIVDIVVLTLRFCEFDNVEGPKIIFQVCST